MYGLKSLAEKNLVSLILSTIDWSAPPRVPLSSDPRGVLAGRHDQSTATRCTLFARICRLVDGATDDTRVGEAAAEMVCSLYAELHASIAEYNATFSHMPPHVQKDNALPIGDEGGPLLCLLSSARKVIASDCL